MSITAFPVLARILEERGLLHTRIGSVALACAAVDDVMAWCLLAGLLAVVRAGDTVSTFALTLLAAAAVAAALATIVRSWLQSWNRRRIAQGLSVSAEAVGLTLLIALASALATELAGVHALFGAFLAGVVVPREVGLAATIADRVDSVIGTTMLPVFFAFTGLRTDIGLVVASDLWLVFALILLVAVSGKLGGSTLAARLSGMPWRTAVGVGLLLNTRGLMELVILNVGLEVGRHRAAALRHDGVHGARDHDDDLAASVASRCRRSGWHALAAPPEAGQEDAANREAAARSGGACDDIPL